MYTLIKKSTYSGNFFMFGIYLKATDRYNFFLAFQGQARTEVSSQQCLKITKFYRVFENISFYCSKNLKLNIPF